MKEQILAVQRIHNCVREKGLNTCADCQQMDSCPTLGQIAVNSPFVWDNLKQIRKALPGFRHCNGNA